MNDEIKKLEASWDELAKIFNNWAGIRPRKSWFTAGVSERTGYKRVRVLESGKQAAKFYDITKDLTERELRYILKRAELNLEQAYSAGRITTVLNATVIIGVIVLFNQIFPGEIGKFFKEMIASFDSSDAFLGVTLLLGLLMGLAIMIIILSYSYGGTAQARDLKHLIELSLARREYYDGKRHNMDNDSEGILKESYLTDI